MYLQFKGQSTYKQEELDEVREEWGAQMLDIITHDSQQLHPSS